MFRLAIGERDRALEEIDGVGETPVDIRDGRLDPKWIRCRRRAVSPPPENAIGNFDVMILQPQHPFTEAGRGAGTPARAASARC